MALCLSDFIHHDRTCRVDFPASVFLGALRGLHECRCVYYGLAHVFPCQEHVANAVQSLRTSVFRRATGA